MTFAKWEITIGQCNYSFVNTYIVLSEELGTGVRARSISHGPTAVSSSAVTNAIKADFIGFPTYNDRPFI